MCSRAVVSGIYPVVGGEQEPLSVSAKHHTYEIIDDQMVLLQLQLYVLCVSCCGDLTVFGWEKKLWQPECGGECRMTATDR